jgi:glycosyltransferase involved in cell wall biosynthesis
VSRSISFLINGMGGGGAETVCAVIANAFASKGYEVDVVVLNLDFDKNSSKLDERVRLVDLRAPNARKSILPLNSYLAGRQPEIVLSFSYELTAIALLIRLISKCEFKIVFRNINSISRVMALYSSLWQRMVVKPLIVCSLRKVDMVINQCEGMEADLLSYYSNFDVPSVVINNPVKPNLDELNEDFALSQECVLPCEFFVIVGRLDYQKAVHKAIEAFSLIKGRLPEVYLLVLGQGVLEAKLKDLASSLSVSDRVRFIGFDPHPEVFMKRAIATLLTSEFEGFPNVLVESITVGTPVIAFDCVSGPSEIVMNGVNGYLVEQGDIHTFSCRMIESALAPMVRSEVKKSACRYSVNNIVDEYERAIFQA